MHCSSVKFKAALTYEQEDNCVKISLELLNHDSVNQNFLNKTVTEDESWVYRHDVETKVQVFH